jgi:hypothetical protein
MILLEKLNLLKSQVEKNVTREINSIHGSTKLF